MDIPGGKLKPGTKLITWEKDTKSQGANQQFSLPSRGARDGPGPVLSALDGLALGVHVEPWNTKAVTSGGVKLGAPVVTVGSAVAVIKSNHDASGLVEPGVAGEKKGVRVLWRVVLAEGGGKGAGEA